MTARHKLTVVRNGDDVPVPWPEAFELVGTGGVARFAISTSKDPLPLMLEFVQCLEEPYYLLFELHYPRGSVTPGRYASPRLSLEVCGMFLESFGELFRSDGFHELWVVSESPYAQVILDSHGILYAYGPVPALQAVLARHQFNEGPVVVPSPHMHPFHADLTPDVERLMGVCDWIRSDLPDEE